MQNSIVYKKERRVAHYADVLQDFRSEMSTTKIEQLSKKVEKLNMEIASLEAVRKWAKE